MNESDNEPDYLSNCSSLEDVNSISKNKVSDEDNLDVFDIVTKHRKRSEALMRLDCLGSESITKVLTFRCGRCKESILCANNNLCINVIFNNDVSVFDAIFGLRNKLWRPEYSTSQRKSILIAKLLSFYHSQDNINTENTLLCRSRLICYEIIGVKVCKSFYGVSYKCIIL